MSKPLSDIKAIIIICGLGNFHYFLKSCLKERNTMAKFTNSPDTQNGHTGRPFSAKGFSPFIKAIIEKIETRLANMTPKIKVYLNCLSPRKNRQNQITDIRYTKIGTSLFKIIGIKIMAKAGIRAAISININTIF